MPAQVMWSEGMLLTPQHLQLSDTQRDLDDWGKLQALYGACAGVIGLEIDAAELVGSQVAIKRISAILPDGTWLNAPSEDLLPPARTIPSGGSDRPLGVSLALAEVKTDLPSEDGRCGSGRYQVEEWKVEDRFSSGRSRRIEVARPSARLLFDGEPTDGLVTLKLLEIARDGTGRWQVHGRYIPPVLRMDASPALRKLVEDAHIMLVSCRRKLIERRGSGAPVELTYSDMLLFWFLHSLNGSIAGLEHVLELGALPPERAYQHLRTCTGYLTTFTDGLAPMDLPPFRPDDLFGSFSKLTEILKTCLAVMLPTHHVSVPMRQHGQHIWRADLPRDIALDKADHVLVLAGAVPDGLSPDEVRDAIKVSALTDIEFIVGASLRGVDLQVLPRPPAGVPVRREALYLRLRKSAPFWESVAQSRELAVFLPGRLVSMAPDLVIIP